MKTLKLTVLALLTVVSAACAQESKPEINRFFRVTAENVNLRKAPTTESAKLMYKGYLDEDSHWCENYFFSDEKVPQAGNVEPKVAHPSFFHCHNIYPLLEVQGDWVKIEYEGKEVYTMCRFGDILEKSSPVDENDMIEALKENERYMISDYMEYWSNYKTYMTSNGTRIAYTFQSEYAELIPVFAIPIDESSVVIKLAYFEVREKSWMKDEDPTGRTYIRLDNGVIISIAKKDSFDSNYIYMDNYACNEYIIRNGGVISEAINTMTPEQFSTFFGLLHGVRNVDYSGDYKDVVYVKTNTGEMIKLPDTLCDETIEITF